MSRYFRLPICAFGSFSLFLFAGVPEKQAQTSQPHAFQAQAHPNHYIILIDASGSTRETRLKRETYNYVLANVLPRKLFEDGFGEVIPPYDPANDTLTLLYFGVVTGKLSQAYGRLREIDFTSELIHSVLIRKRSVTEPELRRYIIPAQQYMYTILSWARTLALPVASVPTPETVTHRTFIIMVHDGQFNEHSSPEREKQWVRTLSNPNFDKMVMLTDRLEQDYQFTNEEGKKEPAWAHGFPVGNPQIFVDAYLVVSTEEANWEQEIKRERPVSDLRIRWKKESGNNPEGILSGTLSPKFVERFRPIRGSDWSVELVRETNLGSTLLDGSVLRRGIKVSNPLTCESESHDALLRIPFSQTDNVLGTRTVYFLYRESVLAPPAFSCTLAFGLWLTGIILAIASVLSVIAYAIYFRFYATHIGITFPGSDTRIRLRRGGDARHGAIISPKRHLEAFTLHLPGSLLQHLFYRNARVKLKTKRGGEAHLKNESGTVSTLKLPADSDNVVAQWDEILDEPTELILTFQQGRYSGQISLMYPKGIS